MRPNVTFLQYPGTDNSVGPLISNVSTSISDMADSNAQDQLTRDSWR